LKFVGSKALVHRKRIEAAIELLGDALEYNWSRDKLKEEMKKLYEKEGISPLRGLALPPDILDKELATLYVVGKYGMGLTDEEMGEAFEFERKLEKAAKIIMEAPPDARDKIRELVGPIDSNALARIFRIFFTATVLGFMDENEFIKLIRNALKLFPDMEKTIRKYARFYVAFRTAEAIAKGEIRNKIEKEAFKQSLALRLGLEKVIPDDNYVYIIAREVFKVPENVLKKILKVKEVA